MQSSMPATGTIASASALDSAATWMVPYFGQATDTAGIFNWRSGPAWQCNKLVLQAGAAPSYAQCFLPLSALDDTAPTIAGVSSSPLMGIKIGTPVRIKGYTPGTSGKDVLLMTGFVAD